MSDKLKQHIDQNRETFEVYPFDLENGWKDLSAGLKVKSKQRYFNWYAIAASVLILLAATWTLVNFQVVSSEPGDELTEAQFYYQDMIDAKLELVKTRVNDPIILADIEELDQAFIELQNDLREDLHNEEVIMAMIDNYRLKLEILERILEELEEENDEKDIDI
jgi:hypothetical protein